MYIVGPWAPTSPCKGEHFPTVLNKNLSAVYFSMITHKNLKI